MRRSSIFALCLALLGASFGSAAFGQITVNGDTLGFDKAGTSKPRPGVYTLTTETGYRWELTVTPSAAGDFNVRGTISQGRVHQTVTGRLGRQGHFRGTVYDAAGNELGPIDGEWSNPGLRITRIGTQELKTGVLLTPAVNQVAQSNVGPGFGLVSKVLGHVPPPGEGNNSIVSGSMGETSFKIEIRMKPPYIGSAVVTHNYSSPLSSRLKPGQVVELNCWSEAERTGRDAPNLGSGCQWGVSGAGAEVLESTHTFAGAGSDGFHPSSRAVTRFKVLNSGTITIVAGQNGQLWGGSDNWNPATYVYKFGARPTATIGAER